MASWLNTLLYLSRLWITLSIDPDSKMHGANMGPIWGRQEPAGPHVGPMTFAIWGYFMPTYCIYVRYIHIYIYVYISYDMCILLSFSFPISLCNRQKWKCKETNIFAGAIRELHTKWISLSDGILTFIIPRCITYPLDKTVHSFYLFECILSASRATHILASRVPI